ncbi:MAG: outer membrane protein assembly factor BamD [Desulfobulbaceae bacterium]|jgi:outer membrane protein assembly factor BamD|nr:outer membrane protein assembly factor BamD [Desulfobulbaceae bacterium]MDH3781832.1 outer membrane protein assembly factor BamD [Desulfobulbaceae bacterium]MDH3922271.1 outer membrane protein assembly factor BamD [Desulfobulbaceae bacterium]MDH3996212.1 outer membrane protein assembly factor BamD [Desulfobulbaceae bacterium]HKJ15627.1 outer membrane protein assembly factor BamD [Desulfobulbales bacterium]
MQILFFKNKQCYIILLALLLTLSLAGCGKEKFFSSLGFRASSPDTAEGLALKGLDYYSHGKYEKAKRSFETLLNQYPFSEYSLLAELKTADSNYYLKNFEEAFLQYKDFEERHPTNEAIPYVMYQMAMCYYNQIDTIDRDTSTAVNAIYSFSRMLRTFPNSPYTEEARARIIAARNFMANHEYYVASFYERTYAYEEAKARLEYLLRQYPDTNIAPQAEMLLYDLRQDNPPGRSLLGWLPKSLPDWEDFTPVD